MLVLAWVISVVFAVLCGYQFQKLKTLTSTIVLEVKAKVDKKPEPTPTSTLIDPDDVLMVAKYEHEELMKKINSRE